MWIVDSALWNLQHTSERNPGYKVEVLWHEQLVQYVLVGWCVEASASRPLNH